MIFVRVKTKKEIEDCKQMGSDGFPLGWHCSMVKFYGKTLEVEKVVNCYNFYKGAYFYVYEDFRFREEALIFIDVDFTQKEIKKLLGLK